MVGDFKFSVKMPGYRENMEYVDKMLDVPRPPTQLARDENSLSSSQK
jgi:hypothetical protein